MNISSVKRRTTLIPLSLCLTSLIYFWSNNAKVQIRITLTTPDMEFVVEINREKYPYRFKFLRDAQTVLIASAQK